MPYHGTCHCPQSLQIFRLAVTPRHLGNTVDRVEMPSRKTVIATETTPLAEVPDLVQ